MIARQKDECSRLSGLAVFAASCLIADRLGESEDGGWPDALYSRCMCWEGMT
jgi:hypothetical protein